MQSAYAVLGIPGNADAEDIEAAFQRARAAYTPSQMVEDSSVAERFAEVLDAYKVLRDPEARAAHDRKLARQVTAERVQRRTPVFVEEPAPSSRFKPLVLVGLLVATLFGVGLHVQQRRQAAQAEIAAKALETARQQAIAEAEAREAAALEARERTRRDALALSQDRALRREADISIARAEMANARQESLQAQRLAAEQREARRRELDRIADEQRRAAEGRRQVAEDRRRIRELCYINYRRYDC